MAKQKTIYVCQSCAHAAHRWLGRCPTCQAWNTFAEEIQSTKEDEVAARGAYGKSSKEPPRQLAEIHESRSQARLESGIGELDRVLGGGLVPGGVVMLGGEPGIGKSTLALQVAAGQSHQGRNVLYVTGEESLEQLAIRARRLGVSAQDLWVVAETSLEKIEEYIGERKPDLVVVDSIQTTVTRRLESSPGSVAQLREITGALTQIAKSTGTPTVLIGHVTKNGAIAGPKILEHMVDTVLYFESQAGSPYRLLRTVKNRFGSTQEIGVFEMDPAGLREVKNPSAVFVEGRPKNAPGSAVVPLMEGTRPMLVEIQALACTTHYGSPRITSIGVDNNRVNLLANILEKRTGVQLAGLDIFINVTGGVRIEEPGADLAIAIALLSSVLDRPIPPNLVLIGELGLTGEIRGVSQIDARLAEAAKLGFDRAVVPANSRSGSADTTATTITRTGCRVLTEAIDAIFESGGAPSTTPENR
jgi:DNA repair protein RadA/Sms